MAVISETHYGWYCYAKTIVDNDLISEALDKIEVKTYQTINDENEKYEIGFIADDVENAIDGLGFDNLINKDNEGMRSLTYDRM
eukprot:11457423-Heterocapsa_arctica.AAC.1